MLYESAAQDVASEAALRAWQKHEQGRPLDEIDALVPLIAYGLAVDEYRRGETPVGLAHDVRSAAFLTQDCADVPLRFDTAARGLESEDFAAFALTELRGLTTREAADVVDTSHMTIYRRRERARLALREELAA